MQSLVLQLQALEEELLTPAVRRSARVAELLADDFVELASSGNVVTKQQIIAALAEEKAVSITTTDFQAKLLVPDVALVTYRACKHSHPPVHSLRSSIWKRNAGHWQMIFHQGTLMSPDLLP